MAGMGDRKMIPIADDYVGRRTERRDMGEVTITGRHVGASTGVHAPIASGGCNVIVLKALMRQEESHEGVVACGAGR